MTPYLITRGLCRILVRILIVTTPIAATILAAAWAGGDPAL